MNTASGASFAKVNRLIAGSKSVLYCAAKAGILLFGISRMIATCLFLPLGAWVQRAFDEPNLGPRDVGRKS
jgi:hypothetical protein